MTLSISLQVDIVEEAPMETDVVATAEDSSSTPAPIAISSSTRATGATSGKAKVSKKSVAAQLLEEYKKASKRVRIRDLRDRKMRAKALALQEESLAVQKNIEEMMREYLAAKKNKEQA